MPPGCLWFPVDFRPPSSTFRPVVVTPLSVRPAFASWASCSRQRIPPPLRLAYPPAPRRPGLAGVSVFRTCEMRPGWVPPVLRGGGVLPTGVGSPIGTCHFSTTSPAIRLTHSISGSDHHEACGDSPTFTRPAFSSPAATGWNSSSFGFYPGFTPRSYPRRMPGRRRSHGHWIGLRLQQWNLQTT